MIVILKPNTDEQAPVYKKLLAYLRTLPGVTLQHHKVRGLAQTLTEIYLLGDTLKLDQSMIESFDAVERVVRIERNFKSITHPGHYDIIWKENESHRSPTKNESQKSSA